MVRTLNLGRLGCAKAITDTLFIPLIEQGKLTYEQVADLWVSVFLDALRAALSDDAGEIPYQSQKEIVESSSSIALVVSQTIDPSLWLEKLETLIERVVFALKLPLVWSRPFNLYALLEGAERSAVLCNALRSQTFPEDVLRRLEHLHRELQLVITRVRR